ncbi:quinone oxidoreductase family protein [Rhizobium sp. G21]|uniref:quinone oxidoreductase family protein n=1 Tax=Rhizobium sp. G21 TaxID=2758439 RepID=UPI001600AF52|nr:quinone oxidoreductase [Rhizobium sp. G21]MBB1247618.1 quinone oxidoreductase [Rhizobium sp. G21]
MTKSKAIVIGAHGGREVLEHVEIDVAAPAAGEVQIRHHAIGVNFIDTYIRTGLYPAPGGFSYVMGKEGAGEVIAVGEGVSSLVVGDRVAYPAVDGAYCEIRNIAAAKLVRVPEDISLETAAGMMMKGMTAEYLLNRTYQVGPETVLLFHAAAGGVGLIAGQWAKALGATVIGTAGGPDKVKLALAHGYDHVIDYRKDDFVAAVKDLTGGKGVDVVYDSVGKDTFPGSLDCLKPRGLWASFGQSSGPIEPISLGILAQKGSLYATRPTLFNYIATPKELDDCAGALFSVVRSRKVVININQTYPLAEAARAHADLEDRKTSGTTLLLP